MRKPMKNPPLIWLPKRLLLFDQLNSSMKRRASFQNRSQHKWKRWLAFLLLLLLCFCFGSLVFLQSTHNAINSFMPISNPFVVRPKIAFLFIARNRLPLDFVWDSFFRVIFLVDALILWHDKLNQVNGASIMTACYLSGYVVL